MQNLHKLENSGKSKAQYYHNILLYANYISHPYAFNRDEDQNMHK